MRIEPNDVFGLRPRPPHAEVNSAVLKSDSVNIVKRVYSGIKELVINYDLPPGERLNIEQLAEQMRVSTTPVRECLNRLVAEDLILMIPKMGFFMKELMESELCDLYELNQILLNWSIVCMNKNRENNESIRLSSMSSVIDKLLEPEELSASCLVKFSSDFFTFLANQSGNFQIIQRVRNINDRLHYVRCCEFSMLSDPAAQWIPLFQLYDDNKYEELGHALVAYHADRVRLLPSVVKAHKFSSQTDVERYGV